MTSGQTILTILSKVNFEVRRGETVVITGASGAGKSTLLSILAGLDLPTDGVVYLDGHNLTALNEDGRAKIRAQSVGFIFQNFQLLPSLTALENVMLPLELCPSNLKQLGMTENPAAQPSQIAQYWLARVGLAERVHHYPRQLSGGEQQRVAIARAFAIKPAVLFADEPTGNLDQETGQKVIDLLFELNQHQKTTLVVVTHDEALGSRCDRHMTLASGCLVNHP